VFDTEMETCVVASTTESGVIVPGRNVTRLGRRVDAEVGVNAGPDARTGHECVP
jgi:hypothetical protein